MDTTLYPQLVIHTIYISYFSRIAANDMQNAQQLMIIIKLIRERNLKGGDRRVRIFSAHNNWWATPDVSLPLPY